MEEYISIVDENDHVIASKARATVESSDIYRVSALFIYDEQGNILLGKRSVTKKNNPGLWSPLVNGTNSFGETYEENIIREAQEEIGISLEKVEYVAKVRVKEKHNFFVTFFSTCIPHDQKLVIDPSEIEELRWYSNAELTATLKQNPSSFVPGFLENIFPFVKPVPSDTINA